MTKRSSKELARACRHLRLALGDVLPAKVFWRRDIKTCASGALTKKPGGGKRLQLAKVQNASAVVMLQQLLCPTISRQLQSSLVGFSQVERENAGLFVGLVGVNNFKSAAVRHRTDNMQVKLQRASLQQDEYQRGT